MTKQITLHVMNLPSQVRIPAERAVAENLEYIAYFIYQCNFLYVLISQLPKSPSCAIVTDPFTRCLTTINTYFYVLRQFSTYSQRQGSVGYPHQDSI